MILFVAQASWLPVANSQTTNDQAYSYDTRTIEGWTVEVDRRLLEQDESLTKQALALLALQLEAVVREVPEEAVTQLRSVRLWFSPEYPGISPRAEYHPGAQWLRDHDRNPEMVRGVEFTNIRIFEAETDRMPNFALHELAHAYHHRVLDGGYRNEDITTAFENAKRDGRYARVERWLGSGRANVIERAYAMTTPQEYFAETTEAYFSRNDFYPFTRKELERHDPDIHALLGVLWGTEARASMPSQSPTTSNTSTIKSP
jgi:hypothetical protein